MERDRRDDGDIPTTTPAPRFRTLASSAREPSALFPIPAIWSSERRPATLPWEAARGEIIVVN